jgi:hypothetical protein
VHTLSDLRELSNFIVRKPYPIPKISIKLQELQGFNYATALNLNMGYCTIMPDPAASPLGKVLSQEIVHGLWRLS